MEIIKNFFKSIWNFFFGKKNVNRKEINIEIIQKKIESKIVTLKPRTQRFNKQQLLGKTYRLGKSRFRIIKKSAFTEPEKLRYEITQL